MQFRAVPFSILAVMALAAPAGAQDFYAGKTIDFIIGSNPGGGFDIYARTIARHMPRYIPGNPTIVAKNLPGAGSTKAATFIYSVAPKDGTALGATFPGAIMDPLLGDRAKAAYDPPKLQYVGTADNATRICITWHTSATKTFQDARTRKTIVGASQAGGSSRDYAYMHNKLNGTQFEVVSGYKGTVDILLAIERGEVDGTCGYDWGSLKTQRPDWIRDNKVNILVQVALEPDAELTKRNVPRIFDFVGNDADRKTLELIISQQVFGRPYFLPPGAPADRVKLLRDAFMKTMVDKDFLEDAKKQRLDIDPLDGAKVQAIVERLYAAPAEIVERANAAVKP